MKSLGNEAYVAANKQDWPEAIRILKKALESCQDCELAAALHKNLGLALCSNGNLDEGKQELQEALKLNPNDPDIVKALSVVAQSNRHEAELCLTSFANTVVGGISSSRSH